MVGVAGLNVNTGLHPVLKVLDDDAEESSSSVNSVQSQSIASDSQIYDYTEE